MASTDTRSGFRLPWSSDRSHDEAAPATETTETPAEEVAPANGAEWPVKDTSASPGPAQTEQRPADDNQSPAAAPEEPEPMVEMDTAVVTAPAAAPKRPSKLMADLTAAIRATAEAAREQSLTQVVDDVKRVVEQIREGSTEGATALKNQSEEDIAAIREWSKAEIARIRDETESRITSRKATLDEELAGHAAAVERRVDEVQAEVTRFEAAMAAYLERLGTEDDPARLASMAEEMPEPPSLETWADLGTLDISLEAAPAMETIADPWATPEPEAAVDADVVAEAVAEPVASDDGSSETVDEHIDVAAVAEHVEAVFADFAAAEVQPLDGEPVIVSEGVVGGEGHGEAVLEAPHPGAPDGATSSPADPWTSETAWGAGHSIPTTVELVPTASENESLDRLPASGLDPADHGSIMAALEAAAEAVVVTEAAAESADQAEAALNARVDAGGFETDSFADRLASLLPTQGEGSADEEPRTTQVVVSGLVSVASIASFKRHLGRLAGVQNVAVASGPEGEFVFNLTHRADLSFRDAIPTMPGFAARVTSTGDGVVNVTARDPETEG